MDNKGHTGEEHFYSPSPPRYYPPPQKIQPDQRRKPFWQRHIWPLIVSILIIISGSTIAFLGIQLLHKSPLAIGTVMTTVSTPTSTQTVQNSQFSPTPTETPTTVQISTPTPRTSSGLPCVVDISKWAGGSPDWVVHDGILYSDGSHGYSDGPTIIAPCLPGTKNYAVETKIQVMATANVVNPCFGIVLRGTSGQGGWNGYKADICGLNTTSISVYGGGVLTVAPFTPGLTLHTYRVVVQDYTIQFFIDNNLVDTATDNHLLTSEQGEEVGLYSTGVQLQVTSFQVTAL